MGEQKVNNDNKVKKNKVITVTIVILFVITIGISMSYCYIKMRVYRAYKPSKINVIQQETEVEYVEVGGIVNILLIGTDARDLNENSRADSIIIATLDTNNKEIRLTSLFRDTLVDIPGYGENKLNAAMAFGGTNLLIDSVASTYDIQIDKYIVINFWGFEKIIDQIGGLEIDVKEYQLKELNKYIGEATGGNNCPITEVGLQTLNGKQALSYARIRKGVGDEYERTERQREVILKVAEKLRETKPSKYLGIMNSMLENISTNIEPVEALNLAYTVFKFPSLNTKQIHIPLTNLAETIDYKNIGSVFIMDRYQNRNILHNFIFYNITPDENKINYGSLYAAISEYKSKQCEYEEKNNIGVDKDESDDMIDEEGFEGAIMDDEIIEDITE